MRRFLVVAGMGTMVVLGPAAPALADTATAAQPRTQAATVTEQRGQQPNQDRDEGSNAGLWGLLGLTGLLGLAGMRRPRTHHDVGVSERPGTSGR